jgi:hypothetical protein
MSSKNRNPYQFEGEFPNYQHEPRPGIVLKTFGALVMVSSVIVGFTLGKVVGAAVTDSATLLTEQPGRAYQKEFNWLLAILGFGLVFIAGCVLLAAGAIVATAAAQGRETASAVANSLEASRKAAALAAQRPPASATT